MSNFHKQADENGEKEMTPFPIKGQEVHTHNGDGIIVDRRLKDSDWSMGVIYQVKMNVTENLEWHYLEDLVY